MDLSRIRLLLVAWWCAAVLPGLVVAVFLWDEAEDGAGAAATTMIWIAGYVAQLVLFMAVARHVKGIASSALLWVPVSLLPWAIDWGPALGWAAETAFVLLAVVVALYVLYRATGFAALRADGVRAAAAAAAERRKPASGRGSSGRSTWRFTSWRNPAPRTQSRTYAPYAPPPAGSAATASAPGVVGALRELAALHESGQLTDDELAQAKRELLGGQDSALPE